MWSRTEGSSPRGKPEAETGKFGTRGTQRNENYKRFVDTDGDLKELAKTLVAAPEAWASPPTKLKRPSE